MTREDRYLGVISYFQEHRPEAETELVYSNPYELLVAVILSAQCTDKRINLVTPAFFQRFPNADSLAQGTVDEIFSLIKSVSYPNNKAKHLSGMGKQLFEKYNSIVPDSIEELQTLPGVGRKTANVIASVVYNQPTMAVDTHVYRVSKRLGLVNQNATTPLAVELQLYKNLPEQIIPKAHHWLILHGRYVCLARKPKCDECGLKQFCRFFQKNPLLELKTKQL